jgi:hypothetical protein
MVDADHRVAFLMTNLLESFNVRGALAQGFAVGDLPDDRGLAMSNQTGNLVSFNLAEVFVTHRATSTCRSGGLQC